MKKQVTLLALTLGLSNVFAQDLLDKKQRPILPEAKDWGISIDATPFINLASDMVHIGAAGTNTAGLNFNGLNDKNQNYSIAGKYFMNNTTAYRGIVRVYNNTNTEVAFINKLNLKIKNKNKKHEKTSYTIGINIRFIQCICARFA